MYSLKLTSCDIIFNFKLQHCEQDVTVESGDSDSLRNKKLMLAAFSFQYLAKRLCH